MDLKWRTGFGWGVVAVIGISTAGFILTGGVLRWISLLVALVATADMIFQYKKWNTHGWRKVHFRAMLAYASVAGQEMVRAQREGRPFSRVNACRELGFLVAGRDCATNVEAMVLALEQEQGHYLANLLETHSEEVLPNASATQVSELADHLRRLELGPVLVVANIVENTFGGLEAARYAVAVLKREAH